MKKIIYIAVLFLIFAIASTSCKKEKGPTTITENPAKATISTNIVDTGIIDNFGSFEFGQKFYPSKNGNITKLGCKMASKGNFRVSLWNNSTKELITSTTINVTDTLNFFYNAISPVSVLANTRYVISLNNTEGGVNKAYYSYRKNPGPNNIPYPFTIGSITYEIGLYSSSAISIFPAISISSPYTFWGVPDMQFEYTE